MTRLGIVGSRALRDNVRAYRIIHEHILAIQPDKIISGGARGIDTMCMEVALGLGYDWDDLIEFLPQPEEHGGNYIRALFARNTDIADQSDILLALMVPGGSHGTEDTIKKAKRRPISVWEFYVD